VELKLVIWSGMFLKEPRSWEWFNPNPKSSDRAWKTRSIFVIDSRRLSSQPLEDRIINIETEDRNRIVQSQDRITQETRCPRLLKVIDHLLKYILS
jgi:hypothetical protein